MIGEIKCNKLRGKSSPITYYTWFYHHFHLTSVELPAPSISAIEIAIAKNFSYIFLSCKVNFLSTTSSRLGTGAAWESHQRGGVMCGVKMCWCWCWIQSWIVAYSFVTILRRRERGGKKWLKNNAATRGDSSLLSLNRLALHHSNDASETQPTEHYSTYF